MRAMQRRSGAMKVIPDEFVITSLDIIIHHDKKLGEGGFGKVFQAEWHGITVAVKVLEKGTPPLVRKRTHISLFLFTAI
jgi:serine/threonine protein kinase